MNDAHRTEDQRFLGVYKLKDRDIVIDRNASIDDLLTVIELCQKALRLEKALRMADLKAARDEW